MRSLKAFFLFFLFLFYPLSCTFYQQAYGLLQRAIAHKPTFTQSLLFLGCSYGIISLTKGVFYKIFPARNPYQRLKNKYKKLKQEKMIADNRVKETERRQKELESEIATLTINSQALQKEHNFFLRSYEQLKEKYQKLETEKQKLEEHNNLLAKTLASMSSYPAKMDKFEADLTKVVKALEDQCKITTGLQDAFSAVQNNVTTLVNSLKIN